MERFDLVMPAAPRAKESVHDALASPFTEFVQAPMRLPADPDVAQHAVLVAVQERRSGAALVRSSAVLATLLSVGFISALLQAQPAPVHSDAVADLPVAGLIAPGLTAPDEAESARPPVYQGEPAVY